MENNKMQQKEIINKSLNSTASTIDSSLFFKSKNFEQYIYKRLEKISLAVYLLSALLSDTEPAKNRLKELALSFIFKGVSLSDTGHNTEDSIRKILSMLAEIYSIFEILQISELISEMNCIIIKEEIAKLSNTITSKDDFYHSNKTSFLTKDFFAIPEYKTEDKPKTFSSHSFDHLSDFNYKGQKDIKDSNVHNKKTDTGTHLGQGTQEDKNKRQETILSMLKDGKVLNVKDFSREIKGCSEKTIQRELLSLVATGTLKKEGERRWSKYSLLKNVL